jgi:hypothetical protein
MKDKDAQSADKIVGEQTLEPLALESANPLFQLIWKGGRVDAVTAGNYQFADTVTTLDII